MFTKILVANRGEIAIRAFRAAVELGAKTVAVFPFEDRNSLHRLKADEAYQIGEPGHPVRAYLDVSEIIRVAKESGADAIYPGYGFLSENPELAQAAAEAGITFIGPPKHVLEMAGNKVTAKEHAIAAGVPVLKSTPPSRDIDAARRRRPTRSASPSSPRPSPAAAVAACAASTRRTTLRGSLEEAMREADSAFGDPTMFLEQAVLRPRHIEVQMLADASGETVHLFERDCSVQRRHQKVIEIAPAPNLVRRGPPGALPRRHRVRAVDRLRQRRHRRVPARHGGRARRPARVHRDEPAHPGRAHRDRRGHRRRPRRRRRCASPRARPSPSLGLAQDQIRLRGAALQCRITTEDPTAGFRPDTGKITTYRSPGGAGIRLDGGTINPGAQISPHFDSMLAKLTCRGRDFPAAVARAKRALAEFRIRGVSTNIPFLQAVLDDPAFVAGDLSTSFIEERPQLRARPRLARTAARRSSTGSPTSR